MATHELKTWAQFWDAVERGEKRFEVRKNDRQFQRGDIVALDRFEPERGCYSTGDQRWKKRTIKFRVGYVLNGPAFGIEPGYCVFALEDIPSDDSDRRVPGQEG